MPEQAVVSMPHDSVSATSAVDNLDSSAKRALADVYQSHLESLARNKGDNEEDGLNFCELGRKSNSSTGTRVL